MKKARVVESCLTLCNPMDYTVHGMLQAFSLLQGIFPTQGLIPGPPHCRRMFYRLSHREAQEYWNGEPIHSPGDLPNPGIKPRSPAFQADSLPAELWGKPRCFGNLAVCYRPQRLRYLMSMPTPCSSWRSAYLVRFLPTVCCHTGDWQRKFLCINTVLCIPCCRTGVHIVCRLVPKVFSKPILLVYNTSVVYY